MKSRKPFWTIAIFYMLIAFEFFYMASPFAIYFYAIYAPGLNFISDNSSIAWLNTVFLPHIIFETRSSLINVHNYAGGLLFLISLAGFIITAGQIYYSKLKKRGVVTGGIYNLIRHPQYTFFIVGGFGLLLLWPRFIVIIPYLALVFAYYFLARLEERECEEKFGEAYLNYKRKTNMFLPFTFPLLNDLLKVPKSRPARIILVAILYVTSLGIGLSIASFIKIYTINNLYSSHLENSVYVALERMELSRIHQVSSIIAKDYETNNRLSKMDIKTINYIMPTEWYVSEIGMHKPKGSRGHHFPVTHNENQFKVIVTQAFLQPDLNWKGIDILLHAIKRKSMLEIYVDLSKEEVYKIEASPTEVPYKGIPRPVI